MYAKDFVIDDCRDRQAIENHVEGLETQDVKSPFQILVQQEYQAGTTFQSFREYRRLHSS